MQAINNFALVGCEAVQYSAQDLRRDRIFRAAAWSRDPRRENSRPEQYDVRTCRTAAGNNFLRAFPNARLALPKICIIKVVRHDVASRRLCFLMISPAANLPFPFCANIVCLSWTSRTSLKAEWHVDKTYKGVQ